jgi:hypothetical protein
VRLGAFGAGLAAILAGSLAVGRATGDVAQADPAPSSAPHGTAHGSAGTPDAAGTSLSAEGLRLDVPTTVLPAAQATNWSFRILDAHGEPVRDFDIEQGKQLHLVLVSRDLSRSAHLHPDLAPDGTWSTRLTLSPGSYRAVADFATDGRRRSLAVDLTAPGPLEPSPLPSPVATSQAADLRVELTREGNRLRFNAFRENELVVPEPYLGARGHLTAFRAGDLAYAHVHPAGADGATTSYDAELPGPGTYRLFLELQVDGTVRTFPFTLEVSS